MPKDRNFNFLRVLEPTRPEDGRGEIMKIMCFAFTIMLLSGLALGQLLDCPASGTTGLMWCDDFEWVNPSDTNWPCKAGVATCPIDLLTITNSSIWTHWYSTPLVPASSAYVRKDASTNNKGIVEEVLYISDRPVDGNNRRSCSDSVNAVGPFDTPVTPGQTTTYYLDTYFTFQYPQCVNQFVNQFISNTRIGTGKFATVSGITVTKRGISSTSSTLNVQALFTNKTGTDFTGDPYPIAEACVNDINRPNIAAVKIDITRNVADGTGCAKCTGGTGCGTVTCSVTITSYVVRWNSSIPPSGDYELVCQTSGTDCPTTGTCASVITLGTADVDSIISRSFEVRLYPVVFGSATSCCNSGGCISPPSSRSTQIQKVEVWKNGGATAPAGALLTH